MGKPTTILLIILTILSAWLTKYSDIFYLVTAFFIASLIFMIYKKIAS